jgi:long-chain acyl-CoA synthetase
VQGAKTAPRPVLGETLLPYVLDLARDPDRSAFARLGPYRRIRWTRGQVLGTALEVAGWLSETGVASGDRVILQGENGPAWVAGFYGCVLRGAVAVPLEDGLEADAAAELARRTSPAAGLGDARSFPLDGLAWRCLHDLQPRDRHPEATGIELLARAGLGPPGCRPEDHVQIVFTSGTTGIPRGVPITHRNLLAGLHPIERGFRKKRRQQIVELIRPRILCLVPASHLFGQVVGVHLPVLMGLPVVFPEDLRPSVIRELIRSEGIMVAIAVPRMLALLRQDLQREGLGPGPPRREPGADDTGGFALSWLRKVWRARRVRRALGWRFSAWISGGAGLDPEDEEFWDALGYLVIQGYGLTETAPIISVSNPFARRKGSVGRPLSGQEIRVGEDGELWVRGANVATGYLDDREASQEAFQDGWLRTGDRVERDEKGRLFIRGRVKDVIVTADGANVDPAAVERVLEAGPEVKEAACVGRPGPRGEEIHAVLVLARPAAAGDDAAAEAAVGTANGRLPQGQRVQGFTVWREPALPRTSLGKLKRAAIRESLAGSAPREAGPRPDAAADPVAEAVSRLTGRQPAALGEEIELDRDLGLSSLDRLDLMVRLEEVSGRTLDESAVAEARTLAELKEAVQRPPSAPIPMPRWARRRPARLGRAIGRALLVTPIFRTLIRLAVEGREHLKGLEPPFLVVANHQSHLDTPAILYALPRRCRRRVAVAMATEHFAAVFGGTSTGRARSFGQRFFYRLAVLLFHAYPLPRRGGFSATLAYTAELAELGYCPLIFPEGRLKQPDEPPPPFREGPAMMAAELGLPVVPAGIRGSGRRLPPGGRFPRPGKICVRFGAPLRVDGTGVAVFTRRLESAVRELAGSEASRTPTASRTSG